MALNLNINEYLKVTVIDDPHPETIITCKLDRSVFWLIALMSIVVMMPTLSSLAASEAVIKQRSALVAQVLTKSKKIASWQFPICSVCVVLLFVGFIIACIHADISADSLFWNSSA